MNKKTITKTQTQKRILQTYYNKSLRLPVNRYTNEYVTGEIQSKHSKKGHQSAHEITRNPCHRQRPNDL